MRILSILTILGLLIAPCIATSENVVTGPYSVSFDLGLPSQDYIIKVAEPKTSETLSGDEKTIYSIVINKTNSHRSILITMNEYDKKQAGASATSTQLKSAVKQAFPTTESREFDGKHGTASQVTSNGITYYIGFYYPNAYTDASIVSSFLWDQGTLSLFKTIQIEKINQFGRSWGSGFTPS